MPPLHRSTIRLWLLPLHHPLQTHSLFIHCRTMSPLGLVVPLPTCIPEIVPTRVLHCHLCRLQLCWLTHHFVWGSLNANSFMHSVACAYSEVALEESVVYFWNLPPCLILVPCSTLSYYTFCSLK